MTLFGDLCQGISKVHIFPIDHNRKKWWQTEEFSRRLPLATTSQNPWEKYWILKIRASVVAAVSTAIQNGVIISIDFLEPTPMWTRSEMAEWYTNPHTIFSYYQPRCLTLISKWPANIFWIILDLKMLHLGQFFEHDPGEIYRKKVMVSRFEDTLPSHGEGLLSDSFFVVRNLKKQNFLNTGISSICRFAWMVYIAKTKVINVAACCNQRCFCSPCKPNSQGGTVRSS